jgi:hypothetical protein
VRPSASAARLLAASTVLALTACASGSDVPAERVELTADVVETRAARSQATVSVALTNAGSSPVEVERLSLRSPAFEQVPPTDRPLTVPAGAASGRFFLPYGAPVCDREVAAVLVVAVRTDDGVREVEAPVTDRTPGLGRLHELACAAEAVADEAEVGFGDRWERAEQDGEQLLRTTLRLERRGDEPVAVTRLDGNVVFSLTAPHRPVPRRRAARRAGVRGAPGRGAGQPVRPARPHREQARAAAVVPVLRPGGRRAGGSGRPARATRREAAGARPDARRVHRAARC